MPYTPIANTPHHIGEQVTVGGWVHSIRNMGKMAFIDVRDWSGILQVVMGSEDLPSLGAEWVIEVSGPVKERGEQFQNPELITGDIELAAESITVLSQAKVTPIEINKDTRGISEEVRLQYRYLDLRSQRMQQNLRLRHKVKQFLRNHLTEQDFIEVETPLLTKGTPEGAREFLVPSRLHPGNFYVLPQSPQQFKQLLMVGGVERYFQLTKAIRDEDQRGDRQPEHTQVDMELSFVDREDILQITEDMMIALVEQLLPDHYISRRPFPRMTYAQVMEQYGTDKPDLRSDPEDPYELAFAWVVDFPMFEIETSTGNITAMHHPFTAPKPGQRELLDSQPRDVLADQFDLVLNGYEAGGGSMRINDQQLQYKILEILGIDQAQAEQQFGHMLEAFQYGVPPHGGIALGLDRLLMIFANEPNIREVMAFPKTGDARDPMMNAPGPMPEQALKDVHIDLDYTQDNGGKQQ
jgi:aspartyl-tRNA synthetase